jgi:AraC-like DNA-binding protein
MTKRLSSMKVAKNMRISPRYVQRLLEMSGTSFTEQVNELRLQRAYILLARENKSRISDVALQAGFSDISPSTDRSVPASAIHQRASAHPKAVSMRGRSKALIKRPERGRFPPRGLPS